MFLQKLKVRGIRNIRNADLDLSPGANLFFGQNGSGKTSLLEAVYIPGTVIPLQKPEDSDQPRGPYVYLFWTRSGSRR